MESGWIAVAATILSAATLVLSGISIKRKAGTTYVQGLERRLEMAELALERCRESEKELKAIIAALETANANLMRMLVAEKGSK